MGYSPRVAKSRTQLSDFTSLSQWSSKNDERLDLGSVGGQCWWAQKKRIDKKNMQSGMNWAWRSLGLKKMGRTPG